MPFFMWKGGILKRNSGSVMYQKYTLFSTEVLLSVVLLTTADMGQGLFRARRVTSSALAVHSEHKQEK